MPNESPEKDDVNEASVDSVTFDHRETNDKHQFKSNFDTSAISTAQDIATLRVTNGMRSKIEDSMA